MREIDLTFNLSWQSEVLLKVLENCFECYRFDDHAGMVTIEDLEHLRIKTFPLYNCRERGICLAVNVDVRKPCTLLIFFAPNRVTDSLFVWWEEVDKLFLNAPTIDDFSEHSYENQIESFGEDFIEAAKFICRKIGDFHRVRTRENM